MWRTDLVTKFRSINEPDPTVAIYEQDPELFTIKLRHGGNFQGRKRLYEYGVSTYIDCVKVNEFCTSVLDKAMEELGYLAPEKWYYYFKEWDKDLDTGLELVTDDPDILNKITGYAKIHREVDLYVTRKDLSDVSNSETMMSLSISTILGGASCSRRLFQ